METHKDMCMVVVDFWVTLIGTLASVAGFVLAFRAVLQEREEESSGN